MSKIIQSNLFKNISCMRHGFFTRQGGVSTGIYQSLNCGFGSGDDTANVQQNRNIVLKELNLSSYTLQTVYQIHSANVVEVNTPWNYDDRPKADAMVTNKTGIMLGILTADCGPLLFVDEDVRIIAAAHAGWKGALSGIIENTLDSMQRLGASLSRIKVCLGPTIAVQSYEIGQEFLSSFLEQDLKAEQFFKNFYNDDRIFFDLPSYIVYRLKKAGIVNIDPLIYDTYDLSSQFFSYRRATHNKEPDYGRQISVIALI
ncbi:MAG: peptidoglycan editing factor PgeF [Alphaproteobacteria bacterium]|nr:peptidoglycan editing factor PgeF [Alphaproteobacteria bacterium]